MLIFITMVKYEMDNKGCLINSRHTRPSQLPGTSRYQETIMDSYFVSVLSLPSLREGVLQLRLPPTFVNVSGHFYPVLAS